MGLGFRAWNMVLNEGIWDPKPRVTNVNGTNFKSLRVGGVSVLVSTMVSPCTRHEAIEALHRQLLQTDHSLGKDPPRNPLVK